MSEYYDDKEAMRASLKHESHRESNEDIERRMYSNLSKEKLRQKEIRKARVNAFINKIGSKIKEYSEKRKTERNWAAGIRMKEERKLRARAIRTKIRTKFSSRENRRNEFFMNPLGRSHEIAKQRKQKSIFDGL